MARPWAVCCVTMPRSSTPRAPKLKNAQPFTRKLLAWYARAGRDLPWRRTRDPFRVLVSEFMLQQTQVSRVAEYYPRFLERFPDLGSLARSPARAVREAWDGLGYYARARNLHALAKQVAETGEAGKGVTGKRVAGNGLAALPENPEELIKLPGIGPYTAGAVASFAYEKAVPAVDTNVARVIRRVFFGMRDAGSGIRGRRGTSASRIPHPARFGNSHVLWCLATASAPGNSIRR